MKRTMTMNHAALPHRVAHRARWSFCCSFRDLVWESISLRVNLILRENLALIVSLWLAASFIVCRPTFAQGSGPSVRPFVIGYLLNDPEAQIPAGALYDLRSFLLNQGTARAALQSEGLADIALLPVDRHESMVERMSRNEFDLAFCSAVDFVLQTGDYEVRFQLRRPQDSYDPQGGRVFHKGIIFVNNRSPLFRKSLRNQEMASELSSGTLALVSGSASGFYYPSLKLARLTPQRRLPQRVFLCDSSEELIKTVLHGLAGSVTAGACEASALDNTLAKYGLIEQRQELVRVVFETDPIPGEPIALQKRWSPRYSTLGRVLSEALPRYFAESPDLPRLEPSSNDKFQDLRENLREYWALVGLTQRRQ